MIFLRFNQTINHHIEIEFFGKTGQRKSILCRMNIIVENTGTERISKTNLLEFTSAEGMKKVTMFIEIMKM